MENQGLKRAIDIAEGRLDKLGAAYVATCCRSRHKRLVRIAEKAERRINRCNHALLVGHVDAGGDALREAR